MKIKLIIQIILMSLSYLHYNIFKLSMCGLATYPGSISQRLGSIYVNYFYKVNWRYDLEHIPLHSQEDFLLLKKIIIDDIIEIQNKSPIFSHKHLIRTMHWRKARKAAELICSLYFDIDRELKNQRQN